MQRWTTVRSIIDSPNRRNGGSLANISDHLPDIRNVDVSTLTRALTLELGSDNSNNYARLHAAFRESSLQITVDARHIITIYRALSLAHIAFHEPRRVCLKLLKDYNVEGGEEAKWPLADVLWVLSIATITEKEMRAMKVCTQSTLPNDAPVITIGILVELCPSVMETFRSQILARLPDSQRLKLLANEEDKALRAFHIQSNKVIGMKRRDFFIRRFLHRALLSWRFDLMLVRRYHKHRKKMALVAWLVHTKQAKLSRIFISLSHINFCKSRRRCSLLKLAKHASSMKKIKRCYTSVDEKNIRAGVGHIRIWLRKIMIRQALLEWVAYTDLECKAEWALRWHLTKIMRRAFHKFNSYALDEIKARKTERKALIQQSKLQKHIKNIQAASLIPNDSKVPDTLLAKQERAKQYEEARLRQVKLQHQIDANIIREQREHRRERVDKNYRRREDQFQSTWAAKKVEVETACLESNKEWLLTQDFKHKMQKKMKETRRHLSIQQASSLDKDRENAITSSAVISYSILDAKLAKAGVVPDDLFLRLEQLETPINAVPFQAALISCGLVLDATIFEEIFNGLAQCKQVKPPMDVSVSFVYLQELRLLSNTYLGEEGTRWKMYVDEHNQVIVHDIVTDEKIFEKDMKKRWQWRRSRPSQLSIIVSQNLLDEQLLEVRKKHSEERHKAHREMMEYYAANCIQAMYYQWTARQFLNKQRWAIERRKLFRLRVRHATAVLLIQRKFRLCRSKNEITKT